MNPNELEVTGDNLGMKRTPQNGYWENRFKGSTINQVKIRFKVKVVAYVNQEVFLALNKGKKIEN
jgi:hypothetical protein